MWTCFICSHILCELCCFRFLATHWRNTVGMHFQPSLPKKTISFVCRSIVYGVPYCRPNVPQQPAGSLDCGWYTALFFQHVVRSITTSTLSDVSNKFASVFTSEMFSHSQIDTYREKVLSTMVPMYVYFLTSFLLFLLSPLPSFDFYFPAGYAELTMHNRLKPLTCRTF